MIVNMTIPASTRAKIDRDNAMAVRLGGEIGEALFGGAFDGAEEVRRQLIAGELDLTMRNPGSGMASGVEAWREGGGAVGSAAIGMRGSHPARPYGGIHEHGGVITPKRGRFLSVPISAQARQYEGAAAMGRDVELTLIPRKGKPALLVEQLARRGKDSAWRIHWILLASVTMPARHWLTRGVHSARRIIGEGTRSRLREFLSKW
jgi:hypothetical protein